MYNRIIIALGTLIIIASVSVFSYSVHVDRQIERMQSDAISEITASVELKDYRKKEKKKISDIIGKTSDRICSTDDSKEIDRLIADAKKRINKASTDKELTAAEKKAAAKREAAENQASTYNYYQPEYNSGYSSTPSYGNSGAGTSGGSDSGGCVGNDAANFY